jgi:C4-dicarboxylate transporter DctM subunit
MSAMMIGVQGIVLLFILLFAGVPIAWTLGIVGSVGLLAIVGPKAALAMIFTLPWAQMTSYNLILLPIFMFMGTMAFESGVGSVAFDTGNKWFGKLPGGLAVATSVGCGMFAATTGSTLAGVVTIGKPALVEMEKYKYDPKLCTGCIAASGTFGMLIPPSGLLVLYGIITGVSIGKCFFAGIIPGIITVITYSLMIMLWVTLRPGIAPKTDQHFTWKERFIALFNAWPIFVLAVIVLGGIYTGIMTVTEAGVMGTLLTGFLLVWKAPKGKKKQAIWAAFKETVAMVGLLFAIVYGVFIFQGFVLLTTIPAKAASWIVSLPISTNMTFVLILLLYLPLGMVLEPLGIMFITMPIIFPVVMAMGFDGVWFSIIMVKVVEIAQITPPVGMNVYTAKGVAPHVPMEDIFRGIIPFFFCDAVVLTLLVIFPKIVTWLPSTMMVPK